DDVNVAARAGAWREKEQIVLRRAPDPSFGSRDAEPLARGRAVDGHVRGREASGKREVRSAPEHVRLARVRARVAGSRGARSADDEILDAVAIEVGGLDGRAREIARIDAGDRRVGATGQ